MARNKDPAVLFYPEAYLVGTRLMNYEQKGKYMELLCLQHQQGHLSEDDMLSICGDRDVKIFSKFTVDDNGCYYNERMEEESIRRARYTESRRANGLNGGRPPTNKNHMLNHMDKDMDNHMGNHMRNRNRNINKNMDIQDKDNRGVGEEEKERETVKNLIIERFDRFWSVYPKKVGKGEARKAFVKLKPSEELTERMIKAVAEAKKSDMWTRNNGQYIPNPSTWLNQERWEDELTVAPEAVSEQKSEVDKWFEEVYMEGAFRR